MSRPRKFGFKGTIVAVAVLALVFASVAPAFAAQPGIVDRVAGHDRIMTSIAAAEHVYDPSNTGGGPDGDTDFFCETVVIANGYEGWPDALTAAGLAGVLDGAGIGEGVPVLLTGSIELPNPLIQELKDLGVSKVYIVGGENRVSDWIVNQLYGIGVGDVERIAGEDRYQTSYRVATKIQAIDPAAADEVYVATGENFPDALAVSPLAFNLHHPIMLVQPNAVPPHFEEEYNAVNATRFTALGDEKAISASVFDEIKGMHPLYSQGASRLGGKDRYETSVLIAQRGVSDGMTIDGLVIATGEKAPDALSAAALAVNCNCGFQDLPKPAVMLLTPKDSVDPALADILSNWHHQSMVFNSVHIMGDQNAVSGNTQGQIEDILWPN